ncbi:hypothetical protein NLI96_g1870 [Meripilus lineatus]|uniref:Uncharacterized protein n=1 Tax=Meripilus lineatus TaxID=2056292 RepID=A0AAD5V9M8_9APHY|nr:hypothetical protein NLI96_g1870 [Physisporinus lineatus]
MANPLLTRISAWESQDSRSLWHSFQGPGTGRRSRCCTAQISRTVPSLSAAIAAFMHTMIVTVNGSVGSVRCVDVEWKWKKGAHVNQSQWSLHLSFVHLDGHTPPIPFNASLEFQPQTDLSRPSFDLPHVVEIRTTFYPDSGVYILEEMGDIFTMLEHDKLTCLNNLERLQIRMHFKNDNIFGGPQTKLSDYLKLHADRWELHSAHDTLDNWERGFEPRQGCDRRYERDITVDGSPIDDVLREWREKITAAEREEGVGDIGEGAESTRE